ncbi:helix-turn-helix transcriptional regulator [Maribacter sp. TH_r10]|uniref:helix-turn-helix domain-containing protein n=1 Tax=Maribacter sp. TH_r10 TaxID=3082086 RepID=UPI00295392CA|nr:helix-turn-helix transcriptional regulator [Maribacter sp. TH_r10]MDV7138248.1 helix-turn-helix transcriptional regulator [Maribacter sp. TH_r10]
MSLNIIQQDKVRALLKSELSEVENVKSYLKKIDSKLNDSKSPYYLNRPLYTKITVASQKSKDPSTHVDDLKNVKSLFEQGKTMPNSSIEFIPFTKNNFTKPYNNVICDSLDNVIEEYDFNGDPFLKGTFGYEQVLLPQNRLSTLVDFYRILPAILNGYNVCRKPGYGCLKELSNELFHHYAPKKVQVIGNKYRNESFNKIDKIINKVVNEPRPIKGRFVTTNIIWNPDYDFTSEQKSLIFNQYNGKQSKNKTFELLQSYYKKGMTQKQLWEMAGVSRSTVKRYWESLKAAVPELHESKGVEAA